MNYKEKILCFLKDKKNTKIIVLFILGMSLLIFPGMLKNEEKQIKKEEENHDITLNTEEKLKNIILSIDGVKKAEVMICFEDGGIKEYYKDEAEDSYSDKIKTDKKIVFKRYEGNEIPVLKREIYPEVKGVTVVADCENKSVYDSIFRAVKAALGADSHKIEIILNDRSK